MIPKERLYAVERGEKFLIPVTIDFVVKADFLKRDGAWVHHPRHPENKNCSIFVTADDLIPIPEGHVENQEPFYVEDDGRAFNVCRKRGIIEYLASFSKDVFLAREYAKEYCAALNAAYRKEQQ